MPRREPKLSKNKRRGWDLNPEARKGTELAVQRVARFRHLGKIFNLASLAEASEHIHKENANVASALKIGTKEDYFELTDI